MKVAFELKTPYNSAEVAVGDRLVRLDSDKPYETTDADEVRALDQHPAVKRAGKASS